MYRSGSKSPYITKNGHMFLGGQPVLVVNRGGSEGIQGGFRPIKSLIYC